MNQNQSDAAKMAERLDGALNALDDVRRENLSTLQTVHSIKTSALEVRLQRETERLGADHPTVKKIAARMEYSKGLSTELQFRVEANKIRVPTLEKDSWMVHGRVLDKNRRGLTGLTVGLFDSNWRWVESLGFACTDERGYFHIIHTAKDTKTSESWKDKELCLGVSDKNQKMLCRDKQPLQLIIGSMEYREIYLTDDGLCVPPATDLKDTEAAKDEWKVQGTVTDQRGRPLAGLEVQLFDKDLKRSQKLGKATTDSDGKFQINYQTKDFRRMLEKNPDLYIEIWKEKMKVYTSQKEVRYNAGRVEVFDVKLQDKMK